MMTFCYYYKKRPFIRHLKHNSFKAKIGAMVLHICIPTGPLFSSFVAVLQLKKHGEQKKE